MNFFVILATGRPSTTGPNARDVDNWERNIEREPRVPISAGAGEPNRIP